MKVAVASDDGKAVSMHFGRCRSYAVLTLEDGAIVARDLRPKFTPHGTPAAAHDEERHGQPRGMGPGAQSRHEQMAETIADCEAVICRGMGYGAYERMKFAGIRPIVTDIRDVDEAALACAAGTIFDHRERLH